MNEFIKNNNEFKTKVRLRESDERKKRNQKIECRRDVVKRATRKTVCETQRTGVRLM